MELDQIRIIKSLKATGYWTLGNRELSASMKDQAN